MCTSIHIHSDYWREFPDTTLTPHAYIDLRSIRRTSSQPRQAWTLPPARPSSPPTTASPSTSDASRPDREGAVEVVPTRPASPTRPSSPPRAAAALSAGQTPARPLVPVSVTQFLDLEAEAPPAAPVARSERNELNPASYFVPPPLPATAAILPASHALPQVRALDQWRPRSIRYGPPSSLLCRSRLLICV